MKNLINCSIAFSFCLLFACSPSGNESGSENGEGMQESQESSSTDVSGTFNIDNSQSEVRWQGEKIVGKEHRGLLDIQSGTVQMENGELVSADFTFDMNSIRTTDDMDAESIAKLEGHLKSADFFEAAAYPVSTFKVTNASTLEDSRFSHEVTGDLTIKGITNSISFPATIDMNENTVNASGTMTFDRSKWDVRYGSTEFFSDLVKDNIISDDISMDFNIVATP